MRYYSTRRPVTPGSFPKPLGNTVLEIVNFDSRIYCEKLGQEAWGYIEYEAPLTENEAKSWELTPEGTIWYPVTVSSRKQGGGLRAVCGQAVRASHRPEDVLGDRKTLQYKTRYFSTLEEAQRVQNIIQSLDVTTERVRMSVTQGEVRVSINGTYICSFGDDIVLPQGDADPDDYYGGDVGGWRSNKPDSSFTLGLIWHPCDHVYHYSDLICRELGITPKEWIEGRNEHT